jgi:hypothetical protein
MIYANNMLSRLSTLALAVALFLTGATVALAATDNASTDESFAQGLKKNGSPVDLLRSDPTAALGATDGSFVSLGFGGELVVGFDNNMSGNLMLSVQEVTGGAYPLETADVYVSTDPVGPWTHVGQASNEEGLEDGISEFMVEECYQYVRIVDTTDPDLHAATADAFDVDSFTADYDEACPKVHKKKTSVHISLSSKAMVKNKVRTVANTGGNTAEGSYAGDGGDGGDIENEGGEQDVEGAMTGNGGTGGNSGLGGAVQTGNASASTSLTNTVNSNDIEINNCECEGQLGRVRIRTHDFAYLGNRVGTKANTGDNLANGSEAGDGGDGGDIENGDDEYPGPIFAVTNGDDGDDEDNDQEVDDSTTGSGGNGGASDAGGSVLTGHASSRAVIVNNVNSNRIRIQ